MIRAERLSKSYGGREAVRDVSFEVKKGEIVGFLGPNGAGKTSTMKMLAGCMAPSQGRAFLSGLDVSLDSRDAKKKLGYMPEAPPLYPDMYVEGFLKYAARLKDCESQSIGRLVDEAAAKTGLSSVRKRLIRNLSKGFKQRVGLAAALVSNPETLILDEPTAGLDPKQVAEVRSLLKGLKGRHTIILSTHILPEVQMSCDRVIIINQGQIVLESDMESLGRKMSQESQIIKMRLRKGASSFAAKAQELEAVGQAAETEEGWVELHISKDMPVNERLAEIAVQGGFGLLEMRQEGLSLEDVFIRLISAPGAPGASKPAAAAAADKESQDAARRQGAARRQASAPPSPESQAPAAQKNFAQAGLLKGKDMLKGSAQFLKRGGGKLGARFRGKKAAAKKAGLSARKPAVKEEGK